MSYKLYDDADIQDIADAIREKNGSQDTYKVRQMGDAIRAISSGLSDEIKVALLDCFAHVAWVDEYGQDYYDALYDALYPPANLVSISAVYTQSGTVYDTDTLDSLKSDLVVTAHYSDQSTETITTYTLSGSLVEGTSTITVSYLGKTTTFDVTVTAIPTIRVFKGKGTSGTSISDNANRALSEPVAFDNVKPITIQYVDHTTIKMAFKNTTTNVNTIDTAAIQLYPPSAEGSSSTPSGYDGFAHTTEELYVMIKESNIYQLYQFTTSSGYARLLFANEANASIPITDTIEGIVKINGSPYRLIEANVSDFE